MEYALITYAIGFILATIWTAKKLWKFKQIEGTKPLKILFSATIGLMSWILVAVYILMWIYENENTEDNSNITNPKQQQ